MSTPDVLTAVLAARGELDPGSKISEAFRSVSRERFTPDAYWVEGLGDGYVPRFKEDDPAEWARPMYRNELIVTQVDGGLEPVRGAVGAMSTCSLSAPGIVALMLRQADIKPGNRVLEIGTGQGFNTALCAWLAESKVVSVEIDATLAQVARSNLAQHDASVFVGDGKAGCPCSGPYDVIISTVAFDIVPPAWLSQLTPDGRIVLPLHRPFYQWGVLTLAGAGNGTAEGEFLHDGNFMTDRNHPPITDHPPFPDEGETTVTTLSPQKLLDDGDAQFAIAHAMPGLRQWTGRFESEPRKDGWYSLWLWDSEGSWAAADYEPGAEIFEVEQFGPRRLWSELEAVHARWELLGRPRVEDWHYIATERGGRLSLNRTALQS